MLTNALQQGTTAPPALDLSSDASATFVLPPFMDPTAVVPDVVSPRKQESGVKRSESLPLPKELSCPLATLFQSNPSKLGVNTDEMPLASGSQASLPHGPGPNKTPRYLTLAGPIGDTKRSVPEPEHTQPEEKKPRVSYKSIEVYTPSIFVNAYSKNTSYMSIFLPSNTSSRKIHIHIYFRVKDCLLQSKVTNVMTRVL